MTIMDVEGFHEELMQEPVLLGFWGLTKKELNGTIGREELVKLRSRICMALVQDVAQQDARKMADTISKVDGLEMTQTELNRWLLSLADLVCEDFDKEEYVLFLTRLKIAVTQLVGNVLGERSVVLVPKLKHVRGNESKTVLEMQNEALTKDSTWSALAMEEDVEGSNNSVEVLYWGPMDDGINLDGVDLQIISESLCSMTDVCRYSSTVELATYTHGLSLEGVLLNRYQKLYGDNAKSQICAAHLMCSLETSQNEQSFKIPTTVPPTDLRFKNAAIAGLAHVCRVWIVGSPKTGKSTIAQNIATRIGVSYIDGKAEGLNVETFTNALHRGGYIMDDGHMCQNVQQLVFDNENVAPTHLIVLSEREEELSNYRGASISSIEESRAVVENLATSLKVTEVPRFTVKRIQSGHGLEDLERLVYLSLADTDGQGDLQLGRLPFATYFNKPKPLLYNPPPPPEPVVSEDGEQGEVEGEPEPAPAGEQDEAEEEDLGNNDELLQKLLFEATVEVVDTFGSEEEENLETKTTTSPSTYSFRKLGPFGVYCPVTREPGFAKYSVLYHGRVYLCKSKAAMKTFMEGPLRFSTAKPALPGKVVLVMESGVDRSKVGQVKTQLLRQHKWTVRPDLPLVQEDWDTFFAQESSDPHWLLNVEECEKIDDPASLMGLLQQQQTRHIIFLQAGQGNNNEEIRQTWNEAATQNGVAFTAFSVDESIEHLDELVHDALDVYKLNAPLDRFLENLKGMGEEERDEIINPRLGWSGLHCPVTMYNRGIYVPGDVSVFTFFNDGFYRFANEEAYNTFLTNPKRFSRPISRPKPIVLILGSVGSGRTVTAEHLSESFNLPLIHEFPRQEVVVEEEVTEQKQQDEGESKTTQEDQEQKVEEEEEEAEEEKEPEPVDEDQIWFHKMSQLLIDHRQTGCVLDGIVVSEKQLDMLLNEKFFPTIVLNLDVDDELAIDRTMKKSFKWSPPEQPAAPEPKTEAEEKGEEEEQEVEPYVPPTKEELEEMREQAREEFLANVTSQVEESKQFVEAALEKLRALNVKIAPTIDMRKSLAHSLRMCRAHVQKFIPGESGTKSFETHRAISIEPRIASLMLEQGVLRCAPLGHCCPVILAENGRLDKCIGTNNLVAYEGYLYQVSTASNLAKFLASPAKYAGQAQQGHNVRVQRRCAIVGNPLTGKSTLANELAKSQGLMVITPEDAVMEASKCETSFGEFVRSNVTDLNDLNLNFVSSEIVAQCVVWRALSSDAQNHGFVLDNFPATESDVEMLDAAGLLPDVIFFMSELNHQTLLKRVESAGLDPKPVFRRFSASKLLALELYFNKQVDSSRSRVYHLSSSQSVWSAHLTATKVLNETVIHVQKLHRISSKVVQNEVSRKQSADLSYRCVPQLLDTVELIGLNNINGNVSIKGEGYCPVTFVESKGDQMLVKCSNMEISLYRGELLGFANIQAFEKFKHDTTRYFIAYGEMQNCIDQLPPSPKELLEQNRIIEYLEATVTPVMNLALEEIGDRRLKHPSSTITDSCMKFLALYLRAHNPAVSELCKAKRQQMLDMFVEECELYNQIAQISASGGGLKAIRKLEGGDEDQIAALLERFNSLSRQPSAILAARMDLS